MSTLTLPVIDGGRRPSHQVSSHTNSLAVPSGRDGNSTTASDSRRPSFNSPTRSRRSSFAVNGRPKKATRPKPRLDEATLRTKQEWTAKCLLIIMRQKVAQRRRLELLRATNEANSENIGGGATDDVEGTDDDDQQPPQESMVNSFIISAIPYMPRHVAAICLVLNLLLPGSGTILSGMTVYCGGRSRMQSRSDHYGTTVCVNLMVGMMQLFTVTFLLVGWFWSIVWGVYMIILADQQQKEIKENRAKEIQAKALAAMSNKLRPWSLAAATKTNGKEP